MSPYLQAQHTLGCAGNINQLVLKLDSYVDTLQRTQGIIAEFVNPKYTDSSRTAFKSATRLECMMQDYPKEVPATAKVGFTVINQVGLAVFSRTHHHCQPAAPTRVHAHTGWRCHCVDVQCNSSKVRTVRLLARGIGLPWFAWQLVTSSPHRWAFYFLTEADIACPVQVWAAYSPVKNSPAEARAKAAAGGPSHSATTGELDVYQANCRCAARSSVLPAAISQGVSLACLDLLLMLRLRLMWVQQVSALTV